MIYLDEIKKSAKYMYENAHGLDADVLNFYEKIDLITLPRRLYPLRIFV